MSYLDKTFCASPNCKNDCGRRMTAEEHQRLIYLNNQYVSYGYFCGEPQLMMSQAQNPDQWDNSSLVQR